MTSKLLPCPFCGSEARELEWPEGGDMDRFCCSNFVSDCIACDIEATRDQWNKRAAPEAPRQSRVATGQWRIPVNGDWFYGTKSACERERAEYESTFTELDREEAGVVLPEQIYVYPLSPDHSGGAGVVFDERAEFEKYYRDRIMGNRTGVRFLRSSSGAYLDREVAEMWSGWQSRARLDKVKELNQ